MSAVKACIFRLHGDSEEIRDNQCLNQQTGSEIELLPAPVKEKCRNFAELHKFVPLLRRALPHACIQALQDAHYNSSSSFSMAKVHFGNLPLCLGAVLSLNYLQEQFAWELTGSIIHESLWEIDGDSECCIELASGKVMSLYCI